MSLWEERAGRNEALFRKVNEEIRHLSDAPATAEFVCECSSTDCAERLDVPLSVYEAVRANARQFLVAPGHERPEVEHIVSASLRYVVVEKEGAARRVAEQTDPRG